MDLSHEASLDQPTELGAFGGMAMCRDIGWLVSKTRKEIVLAVGQVLDDNSIRHSNTIPTKWVREIIYLNNPFEAENAPITPSIPNHD